MNVTIMMYVSGNLVITIAPSGKEGKQHINSTLFVDIYVRTYLVYVAIYAYIHTYVCQSAIFLTFLLTLSHVRVLHSRVEYEIYPGNYHR